MTHDTAPPFDPDETARLRQAMATLDAQRSLLGDAVVEAALGSMRDRLAVLEEAARPSRQRKQVTVVFGDIVGFTALSESRDPEVVAAVMNALWSRIDAAVLAHRGRVDKHIGDAIMAVWGSDVAREDDPEQAVRAALAMQQATDACCRLYNVPLSLRVGVHTGPVLAGPVGAAGETTVMGDTVNLANRVESAAPPGSVLASHATYRHIRGIFDVQPHPPIVARGLAAPVVVYRVERAKPRAFRVLARGIEGIETRMVGREAELRALQDVYQAVLAERRPCLLTVVGEAGVGKSRLLYEFNNWLELRPEEVYYYKGRCAPHSAAYGLFHDLFASRFEILDSDTPAVALAKFRAGFAPGRAGADELAAADIVGHWLGFDFDDSPAVARLLGSPEFSLAAQAHLFRYFRARAADDPLVIFLEDLHWADEASLDLVAGLANHLIDNTPAPAFLIALSRPSLFERRPAWALERPGHRLLTLAPLAGQSSRALVEEVLQRVDHLPQRLRERIADASGGNPFYIEELVKMFIEQGVIVRHTTELDERWEVVLDRLDSVRVPSTLVGLIQARLDALQPDERRALQHAAVIGRVFWDGAVAALDEDATGHPALAGGIRRELILRREPATFAGTEEFAFKHALVRDVCYETVLLSERHVLHARAARWLEEHAADRLDECLSVLAAHWDAAADSPRAAAYLARSGELALAAGNHGAAVAALRQAAERATPTAGLLLQWGESAFMISDLPAAEEALEQALGLARAAGDQTAEVNALYWRSRVATARGDFNAARAYLDTALPIARATGGVALARALEGLAGSAGSRGDLATAVTLAEESLVLARAEGDVGLEIRCLGLLGTFARLLADLDAAEARFEAARALAHRAGNLEREATALVNLGDLAYRRDRYEAARDAARAALDLFRDQGRPDAVAVAAGNLAQAELMMGARAEAAGNARLALTAARSSGATPLVLFALSVYAQVIAADDRPLARALLRLVSHHPAAEYQDRHEAAELLSVIGSETTQSLDLEGAVAAILGSAAPTTSL